MLIPREMKAAGERMRMEWGEYVWVVVGCFRALAHSLFGGERGSAACCRWKSRSGGSLCPVMVTPLTVAERHKGADKRGPGSRVQVGQLTGTGGRVEAWLQCQAEGGHRRVNH